MKKHGVAWLAKVAILGAFATVLMLLEFPLFFAPSFYKLDLSEIPVLVGAFALGPIAGLAIEAVKIMVNFFINGTETGGVGELANFLIGAAFIVPASIIYYRHKSKKSAVVGMGLGILSMVVFGSLMNAFFLLPFYATLFHMNVADFVAMGTAINPLITNLAGLILWAVVPFNLVKGLLISIVVLLLYKQVSPLLHDRSIEE
jgi:riboflavin transporter FmnP